MSAIEEVRNCQAFIKRNSPGGGTQLFDGYVPRGFPKVESMECFFFLKMRGLRSKNSEILHLEN